MNQPENNGHVVENGSSIDSDSDSEDKTFARFASIEPDPPERRPTCRKCGRPSLVCLCPFFPKQRLALSTSVYLVQHPNEESRVLRTAPMLTGSLCPNKCQIFIGKRLSSKRSNVKRAELEALCSHPNALLLYPGPEAIDITEVPRLPAGSDQFYRLILIDGTWPQAKYIYNNNKMLHMPRQVQFSNVGLSQYVIRTQPTDQALSTVESAAIALSVLEGRPEIQEILVAPLKALCQFQLQHGAVVHESRERRLQKMNESSPSANDVLPNRPGDVDSNASSTVGSKTKEEEDEDR